MTPIGHWINRNTLPTADENTFTVLNPATGANTGRVALATCDNVDRAVESAARAFRKLSQTPLIRRVQVLFNFLALLNRHLDELAAAITGEHSKVALSYAQCETTRGIKTMEFACEIPQIPNNCFFTMIAVDETKKHLMASLSKPVLATEIRRVEANQKRRQQRYLKA